MASSAIPPPIIFLSLLPFLPLFAASNVPLGSSPSATNGNSSLADKGASNPAEDSYDLIEVPNINFLFGDDESLGPLNLTHCIRACSQDSDCVVAIFNGISCWKKILPIWEDDVDWEEDDDYEEEDDFEEGAALFIDF
ncbi:uncharacterized protein LOC131332078 [Rhododendron vialii]|uniref:uncharacterized protein LOC131332078 n=1 Tax=Rhododendron vialii TaxID=182163 RepID=UPI00265EF9C1|nr:uncharacterized protein LOC131332078 [Rhododendron vialii]